jgi:hypothetical protein
MSDDRVVRAGGRSHRRRGYSKVPSLFGLISIVALAGFVPAASSRTEVNLDRQADRESDEVNAKPRVFILTDIGIDPDDSESLVRFLLYSNEFDVEGMAAVTSTWMRDKVHPELIDERVRR